MRVTLLNPMPSRRGKVNKDVSGGFGTVSDFGTSPVARGMTWLKRIGVSYPVLSLGYAAAIFERAGWQVSYGESAEEARGADLALVYSSLVAHRAEIEVADGVRALGGPRVGFFGPFATVRPDLFLDHADFVVSGEPEEIVGRLAAGERFDAKVTSHPIERLDDLPFPAWQHFAPETFRYRPYFPTSEGGFFPVLSSRGCTLSCAYYCPYTAVTGRRWRKRAPENVLAEIVSLRERFGARRILFRDPLFTLDRERIVTIARLLHEAKLGIEWVCETHLDFLDEDLLDRMRAAGLRSLKVGIESANGGLLANVKRHQAKEERIRRILAHCDRRGIGVVALYILGLPGDTTESIEDTVDFAADLNTIGAQFTIATPYPGTGFYADVESRGDLLTHDWDRFDIYTPVLRHDTLTPEEILDAKSRAYQKYYLRPKWAGKFLTHWWRRARGEGFACASTGEPAVPPSV